MVHDRDTLALYMSPGHHGNIHRQKYFDQRQPFPVAISFGPDPLLWYFGQMDVPPGESEYDYAGGIRGEPYEVILGEHTGYRCRPILKLAWKVKALREARLRRRVLVGFSGIIDGGRAMTALVEWSGL